MWLSELGADLSRGELGWLLGSRCFRVVWVSPRKCYHLGVPKMRAMICLVFIGVPYFGKLRVVWVWGLY